MNAKQIDFLKSQLLKRNVFWFGGKGVQRITGVVPPFDGEPSQCAFLTGGGYIVLCNADPDDFSGCVPLFEDKTAGQVI